MAWQVMTALVGVAPARVGGECVKLDRPNLWGAWATLDSALGVVLLKEPAALTADDARLIACAYGQQCTHWISSGGQTAVMEAAGLTAPEWIGAHFSHAFLLPVAGEPGPLQTTTDDRKLALVPMLLDSLKAPEQLPDFVLRKSASHDLPSYDCILCRASQYAAWCVQPASSSRSHTPL
jgi:hypothetical protein